MAGMSKPVLFCLGQETQVSEITLKEGHSQNWVFQTVVIGSVLRGAVPKSQGAAEAIEVLA